MNMKLKLRMVEQSQRERPEVQSCLGLVVVQLFNGNHSLGYGLEGIL